MHLRPVLKQSADTVLIAATGGSSTALGTYLRLLVEGCVEFGALFVTGSSPEPREFDGVALWGPPRDDWLTWYVSCAPHSPHPGSYFNSFREEEGFLSQLRQEKRDWITDHVSHYLRELETLPELQA